MGHDSLNKTVIRGCVFSEIIRGRPRNNWIDNIMEWAGSEMDLTQLLEAIGNHGGWRRTYVAEIHITPIGIRSTGQGNK